MYWRGADWPSALRRGSGNTAATAVVARNSRRFTTTSSPQRCAQSAPDYGISYRHLLSWLDQRRKIVEWRRDEAPRTPFVRMRQRQQERIASRESDERDIASRHPVPPQARGHRDFRQP